MGCHPQIRARAGPKVPPAQRRPGPAPPANVPSRLKFIVILIVILTRCRDLTVSPPLPPDAMPSNHSRASLLGWTESRCDSVCLQSRHFVAMPCPSACECFRRRAWSAVGALPSRKNARIHQNWPKYHFYPFYTLKPHPTMTQRIAANPRAVGRVTPCTPRLASTQTGFPMRPLPKRLLNA